MLRLIEDMPPGTVGIEAVGQVTHDDYRDVLVPVVEEALQRKDVRMLCVLHEDFRSYSTEVVRQDARLWIRHLTGWRKLAVVTSHQAIHDGVRTYGWMMPGEVRLYDLDEIDAAKAWLAETTRS